MVNLKDHSWAFEKKTLGAEIFRHWARGFDKWYEIHDIEKFEDLKFETVEDAEKYIYDTAENELF
jgi:hypothetical protein